MFKCIIKQITKEKIACIFIWENFLFLSNPLYVVCDFLNPSMYMCLSDTFLWQIKNISDVTIISNNFTDNYIRLRTAHYDLTKMKIQLLHKNCMSYLYELFIRCFKPATYNLFISIDKTILNWIEKDLSNTQNMTWIH